MGDVELVIKIPEEIMEYIKNNGCLSAIYKNEVAKAIIKGTPLPKGHGRIMDVDKVIEKMEERKEQLEDDMSIWGTATALDMFGETIIEEDKEYGVEVITRGNCMMCGKELDEGLFLCRECEQKQKRRDKE